MSIFFTLLGKIIPLYVSIILGFLSTYILKCDKETVAKILLFLLSPLIIFTATININLSAATLSLPLFFFIFSSILSFTLLAYFKRVYSDNSANLLAFSTSTGNTGNIGIPLAILFLEPNMVDVFIFTEAYNCGKILKKALESFFLYHPGQKVHVFGTYKDFKELKEFKNNLEFIEMSDDARLKEYYGSNS